MNIVCAFLLLLEFYLIFIILSLIYEPQIQEDFNLIDDQEPKLITLQQKLSPLFEENCSYQGTILEGIMTIETKRRIKNEISLSKGKKSYTINKEDIFLCLKTTNLIVKNVGTLDPNNFTFQRF